MKKISTLMAVVAAGVMHCSSALAVPVTQWGFDIDSGFDSFSGGDVDGSINNVAKGAPTLLEWGTGQVDPTQRSFIDVGSSTMGNVSGMIMTDGPAVNTLTLTHGNFVIDAAQDALTNAVLSTSIFLTPMLPNALPGFGLVNQVFDIRFEETLNSGTCVVATSPTPCNDIFTIDISGAGFNTATQSIQSTFVLNAEEYLVEVFLTGLGVLDNAVCSAAGAANGCLGLTTIENQSNMFEGSFRIAYVGPVVFTPAPMGVALLGLSLIGIGLLRFRK